MRRVTAMLLAGLTTACFSYGTVATGPVQPENLPERGATVRLSLQGPTTIETQSAGVRDTNLAIIEARGTVRMATADTIVLALGSLHTAEGVRPGVSALAFVPTQRVKRIEVREFEAAQTAVMGVAVYALSAVVALFFLFSKLG